MPVIRWLGLMTALVAALLLAGCSPAPDVQSAKLRCGNPWDAGGVIGLFSFVEGELGIPPSAPGKVDLIYYFDNNDCSSGALLGNADHPGYLFPVGHKPWSEIAELQPPSKDAESVAAITPLTRDKEGLAFWVKTGGGGFVLAKIKSVQPSSYSDLTSGTIPTLELEWLQPRQP